MELERLVGAACGAPFPIHDGLAARLASAHQPGDGGRDAMVAHVLGTCAGYAYGDIRTVATMMSRVGLEGNACVRIGESVDAMYISSTAYLVQSRCGRVVLLCYRGTEPASLANWLGDADTTYDTVRLDDDAPTVHAGFYRNMRATRLSVLAELRHAVLGRSLADPSRPVEHPMEALYVTGHSLGGAMAVLFTLTVLGAAEHRELGALIRAVHTFGQPMAIGDPPPRLADVLGRRVVRHVMARDPVPSLPPAAWGKFTHVGEEHRFDGGGWAAAPATTTQLDRLTDIPRALLSALAPAKRRSAARYDMGDHGPHRYVGALRPKDRVTELGDRC